MTRFSLSGCILLFIAAVSPASRGEDVKPIRVVVWDEQQPAQKQAYDNFLGNAIADHLSKQPGFTVRSMKLDDAEQGLSAEILDFAEVLIWWGHVRQKEIKSDLGRKIVERIERGQLSLVTLHSAHWSTPFMEAMNQRTRLAAAKHFPSAGQKVEYEFLPPPQPYTLPAHGSLLTPAYYVTKRGGGLHVRVDLPNCCFPDYRADGKPSSMTILKPDHPLAAGLGKKFTIERTEMYNEPFHVPDPDEVIFEEIWATGERFRSGMIWQLGKGHVIYFRPGHETFPVYEQAEPLRFLENSVRWLGEKK